MLDGEPGAQEILDLKIQDMHAKFSPKVFLKMQNSLAKCSESTKSHVTRNIPPYDASATTPHKAYLLDQIILKREWGHLEDIYSILQQGEAANFNSYPRFVRNRIDKLKTIEDESEKKKLSCIFSYISHLIIFKDQHFDENYYQFTDEDNHFMDEDYHFMDEDQHSMDDTSSSNHIIPDILRYKFIKMFDVSYTKEMTKEKSNLLISYVVVLTLFADEFQTDYRDIAEALRKSSLCVKLHYGSLGCKFSRLENGHNGKRYFGPTLPVPLQLPDC